MEDSDYKGGVKRPKVTSGNADPIKGRVAKKVLRGSGGIFRNAGMMLDSVQNTQPYSSGYKLDAYRSSYANGLDQRSGAHDIPTYFYKMNDDNGGLLYWPVTIHEKYQWYRYWARTDAYIGRALELLSDLPMSKLTLSVPKNCPEKMREEIHDFYTYQMEVLGMFQLCQDILWEWNMIGNVSLFHEWDKDKKMWSRAIMLPPEEVYIFEVPFSNGKKRVEYRPERLISLIESSYGGASGVGGGDIFGNDEDLNNDILASIPEEIINMVKQNGCIIMDSDPMTGSFVHHIARRKSRYHDLGSSVLERVLVPMLMKEHYKYTQLSLASRNMTPKNLIKAQGLLPSELDELRAQVDLSYQDPDYTIVTNYEVEWEQIGAQDRLLDLTSEYERIENQIFAALGVTRELLTGEGSFSGNKITVEILNTMFLLTRNVLTEYIEKQLFQPIAEAHGWYEINKSGIKKYWYPRVGFNRLTIRDNAEVFDSLYQLYAKGSLDVDVIYELFNINPEEMARKLKSQLFTVKDATFNRAIDEVNTEIGRSMVEKTNVLEEVVKYLGLELKKEEEEEEGEGEDGQDDSDSDYLFDFGGDQQQSEDEDMPQQSEDEDMPQQSEDEDMPQQSEDEDIPQQSEDEDIPQQSEDEDMPQQSEDDGKLDNIADVVMSELPSDASEQDIKDIVQKFSEDDGKLDNIADVVMSELPKSVSEQDIKDIVQKISKNL